MRDIRAFIEERTLQIRNQPGDDDVRNIKGMFSTLSMEDIPGYSDDALKDSRYKSHVRQPPPTNIFYQNNRSPTNMDTSDNIDNWY